MKLAMHNWMRTEEIEVTLKRLARLDIEGLEIVGEPARYDVARVRALLQRYKIECWGAATFMTAGRDLIHEDAYVRYGTVKYMKDCVDLVAGLGGQILCIVPSTMGKVAPMASFQEEWHWAVDGLREIAYHAGGKGVRLGIEPLNRYETYFINRHDQAVLLAQEVGLNMGVVLDTFHLNIEEADPIVAIKQTASYLVDFHVADNNGYPPGRGTIDWRAHIKALREIGYNGYLTGEFVVPIDRTPAALTEQEIDDVAGTDVTQNVQGFSRENKPGVLSEHYYDLLVQQTANFLRPLL
ncbi:MAG: sugar phosphate isomerase/epimerase [Ktedonobacteraceae bacterium]